ncbi:MAG: GMC family oxidoreductase N-terminal domain-containing protein, partial [Acidimicrobiales bacterium]
MKPLSSFDVIVVGAGAAGCVVARRSAASGRRTLLVEAGSAVGTEAITGLEALAALEEPGWLWPDVAAEVSGGSEVSYRQGRGLGGGSAVNSLVLSPGDRRDYDRWGEAASGEAWGWGSMAPWIAHVDAVLRPEPASLGPFAEAFRSVAVAAGHADGGGSARIDAVGYLTAQLAVRAGRRNSVADAYGLTTPDRPHEALVVRTRSTVDRLV